MGWIDTCVSHWARRGAALDAPLLDPWLELLVVRGITPRQGPLTHDWLLPRGSAPRFGLNLFGVEPERLQPVLTATAERLGGDAPRALAALREASAGRSWAAGIEGRGGDAKLKIWLLDATDLARRWCLEGRGLVAVGVDVGLAGRARERAYLRWDGGDFDRGPLGAAWGGLPAPPGLSHRILARLPETKWSYDHVFAPDASLDALRGANQLVAPFAADRVDLGFCEHLDAALEDETHLRAAAFELDRYDTGEVAVDALVTVGAA